MTLANYALRNPTFAAIVAQSEFDVKPTMYTHGYQWANTNSLLTSYQGAERPSILTIHLLLIQYEYEPKMELIISSRKRKV